MAIRVLKQRNLLATTNYSTVHEVEAEVNGIPQVLIRKSVISKDTGQCPFREYDALANNQGEGIVRLVEFDRKTNDLYFEPAGDQTLWAAVRNNGPLSPTLAQALVGRVALAMASFHEQTSTKAAYVHYDLTSSNIMLKRGNCHAPTVVDFGTAFPLGAIPEARFEYIVGTPGFRAPEQELCQPRLGQATDVYGLGVIGYHALTGALMLSVESREYPDVKAALLEPLRRDPSRFNNTLVGMLETQPRNRPTIREVAEELL